MRCSTRRRSATSAFATASPSSSRSLAFGLRARWPRTPAQWGHVAVAGLLSHAGYLGGSHYAQRWGLSAGITALVLALQPLLTAVVVSRWLHERLGVWQKVGVGVGLAGVALVVGPRAVAGAVVRRQPARRRLGARLRDRGDAVPAPVRRRHRPARGGLHPLRRDRRRDAAARRRRRRLRDRVERADRGGARRTTSSSARSAPTRSCTCSCATARRPA